MNYPLTAVVGKEKEKKALYLSLINPTVGGVLLIGDRGTGKSVMIRGLKEFCRRTGWTELPVHANAEQLRMPGGLLERGRKTGLSIDEVNLLSDETAAILTAEASEITLWAAMDPLEGGIPEGLRERFGLSVCVETETEPRKRAEIIQRSVEYADDPQKFCGKWASAQERLMQRIKRRPGVWRK